jgi:hypothetical protein
MKQQSNMENFKYIPLDDYKNFYYCTDIELASTLCVKNFELVSIDKITESKVSFIFRNEPEITNIVNNFWANKVTVFPLEFANARKNLKTRVFAMKGLKTY